MKSFIKALGSIFISNPYGVSSSNGEYLFIYDDKDAEQTFMSEVDTHPGNSMTIINHSQCEVSHICIDGGLIEYGLPDYVGDGLPHGRNDCMAFTNAMLLLIELKMDVTEVSLDKTRWGRYSEAMHQLSDFYLYLIKKLEENGHPMDEFYSRSAIHPIVCMKNPPKPSAQRNNEKEKFRLKTNLIIETEVEYSIA